MYISYNSVFKLYKILIHFDPKMNSALLPVLLNNLIMLTDNFLPMNLRSAFFQHFTKRVILISK